MIAKLRTNIAVDTARHLELAELQIKVRRAWGRRLPKSALADVALRRNLDGLSVALERGEAPPAGLLPRNARASDSSVTPDSTEAS